MLFVYLSADSNAEIDGSVKYAVSYVPVTKSETEKSSVHHITDIQEYKSCLYSYPILHTVL